MADALLLLASFTPVFPWDRVNESLLGHHHLVAAYCFTWGLQLSYLAYVVLRWRRLATTRTPHSSE